MLLLALLSNHIVSICLCKLPVGKEMAGKQCLRRNCIYILLAVVFVVNTTVFQFQIPGNDFDFHSEWHPIYRSERFPSVEERVKLYMSNWFLPPCNKSDALFHRQELIRGWPRVFVGNDSFNITTALEFDSIVDVDTPFLFHGDTLRECAKQPRLWRRHKDTPRIRKRKSLRTYCSEAIYLSSYVENLAGKYFPIIGLFGDQPPEPLDPPVPLIGKWRTATTNTNLWKVVENDDGCWKKDKRIPLANTLYNGMSPVLWKFETHRHWDSIESARRQDTKWQNKKLGALWRGDYTGSYHGGSSFEQCLQNQRCSFVYNHATSTLVDAGLSSGLDRIDDTINGIPIVKPRVSKRQIQQYKVIISMEGNDVASGLKWSLLSESVVLMPKPTRTSWAMEELLEEWVHYIPMHPNGSNAEAMIQWVGNNDLKAWRIAERGRMFMYDLLYHPDAARDEILVKEEIARRYRDLWK